ncbi:ABC transporter ATP-binding protein [Streptomyces sp. ISL-43]|uniref:ABC transporter ATP-binding protein n=1 Tax=Streptomyces sp. ISL-43 TaxID=2819183 RepID=UPI001BEC355D|nr:ATP-binding cassette domain-containing protein [Streptomyces sp. ISL-43]MBT2452317.1 ABC transporter ATP-binding protein [Streptomyces sp. ISL-43]
MTNPNPDPHSEAAAVAEVRDLRVEIGGRHIVDGVSLTARAGKVTALVGPSGSGKTTTGLALLGEYPEGARVTGSVRTAGHAVGYVPQHPATALNPARRVGALLHDIARRQGGDSRAELLDRVREALRLAQLPDPDEVLRRFPHQLSGGQQQRVVLAQAFLLGARVLVADEPTTGQDALTRQGVVAELSAVTRHGIAVVLLSHDLDAVRQLADEVVLLRNGRVVDRGTPASVLSVLPHQAPPAAREPRLRSTVRLETCGLTASHRTAHGPVEVLGAVGVSVAAGECLAVVGRSGSGKTTMGRCLAGLHPAYRGEVLLDGRPLARSVRSRRRPELAAVQYVFQDARAAFDEFRPVVDQVARTAVRLRGTAPDEARQAAVRVLGELGLSAELVGRRPGGLSGGELQRAALARALLAEPKVLICDEITSGLDTGTRDGILGVLGGLRERAGLSLLFITHDLAAAGTLADRIAVLEEGRVVEEGPARQLFDSPRHPVTQALLRAAMPYREGERAPGPVPELR